MKIRVKRAYEAPARGDGFRVLVDRIWPRGVCKGDAAIDLWLKNIAPSKTLRQWFDHDPEKWTEFRRRYRKEVAAHPEALDELRHRAAQPGGVTLVFAARNEANNNAVALKGFLEAE